MDSKLQIISGTHRGRKLQTPPSARPTQNRARLALFNMLNGILMDAPIKTVWDAFAGSGAFGIECLSRWPDLQITFTDVDPKTTQIIRRNMDGMPPANVVCADALTQIQTCGASADLVYLDPPYAAADAGVKFVRKLADTARPGTLLVWEQDAQNATAPDAAAWEILRQRQYGRALFYILRRKDK